MYGPWARLAILTGLRQSEQFRLQWKDVDLERGMLTLLVTKAGGVQYVHLNEEVHDPFARLRFPAAVRSGSFPPRIPPQPWM